MNNFDLGCPYGIGRDAQGYLGTLGVSGNCSQEQIKTAYEEKLRICEEKLASGQLAVFEGPLIRTEILSIKLAYDALTPYGAKECEGCKK